MSIQSRLIKAARERTVKGLNTKLENSNKTTQQNEPMEEEQKSIDAPGPEPGLDQVYRYLMFGLSLPERTIRSTAAVVSGAVNESATLLVPGAFQDSKTYQTFVKQMLEMVAQDVGGVKKKVDPENANSEAAVENYVAKKTVGTFVDLAGMATLHVSPLTVLAIVSDVAYGSQIYLNELAVELKKEGVIEEDSSITNTADLLQAISVASAETADSLDQPPISVEGLRETILKTQQSVSKIDPTLMIPQSEIASLWEDMQQIADEENVNVFSVSSAITMYTLDQVNTVSKGALTTIRVTGSLVDRHLFEHYRQGVSEIYEKGLNTMIAESSEPYLEAVWYNFSSQRPTLTEDIVSGKMVGRAWEEVSGWIWGKGDEKEES